MVNQPTTTKRLDIVPRRLEIVSRLPKKQIPHYASSLNAYLNWKNYSNQQHIRDLAFDYQRNWVWMATWGGVLCWQPQAQRCIRYTSEHGLLGNITGHITVDRSGIIWAAGQDKGLCSFEPNLDRPWQSHRDVERWTVLAVTPRINSGIYLALKNNKNQCALGEITAPNKPLKSLAKRGLAIKDIESLLVDSQGTLWIGNAWGLHCLQSNRELQSFEIEGKQVYALTEALGGGLWLGTNWGLYRFSSDSKLFQDSDWTRDAVFSLANDSETGVLWCITAREIGRLVDSIWQPLPEFPPGQLNKIIIPPSTSESPFKKEQVLIGGANGLYLVNLNSSQLAFTPSEQDNLSNAVNCLWADNTHIWMGTARGLCLFDGQIWRNYLKDAPNLRDIHCILPEGKERLWAGSFRIGLQRLEQQVHIPDEILDQPIVSLSSSTDVTLWAATFDAIYTRAPDKKQWQSISYPAQQYSGIIQTICYQLSEDKTEILWIGTSSGLLRYRPQLKLWDSAKDFASGELEYLSIQALGIDPLTNYLWIGTPKGLYSECQWQCHREVNVRSLVFSPPPDGTIWLGTRSGLEQWLSPGQGEWFGGEPIKHFTTENSGIGSNIITALSVRVVNNKQEIWIGTPRGVSCYDYQPEGP